MPLDWSSKCISLFGDIGKSKYSLYNDMQYLKCYKLYSPISYRECGVLGFLVPIETLGETTFTHNKAHSLVLCNKYRTFFYNFEHFYTLDVTGSLFRYSSLNIR